jgi:formylglycine-generating enzyme required for sulfatase activity
VQATGCSTPDDWSRQQQRPDHPLVNVTWHDALAYVQWLAQVTGEPWRLPTEAEWEKAARGTDRRIYPWGNQWDRTRANTEDGGPGDTTPVGSYPGGVSLYGAQDMAGNVLEWTSTTFQPYPYQADDGREDLGNQALKVMRGGAWGDSPRGARSACRYATQLAFTSAERGVRLVLGV